MQDINSARQDLILPFQLDRSDVRGRVARLDHVLADILAQHDYPAPVEALVAEMVMLAALIGPTLKLRWKLSLQAQMKGALRMIATDYYAPEHEGAPARIRAYASFDAEAIAADGAPASALGEGYFAILLDQGDGTQPYQGITPLTKAGLTASAEAYFAQSEQLPTRFELSLGRSTEAGGAEHWRGGGIMLQTLPAAEGRMGEGGSGEGGLLAAEDVLDADQGENWRRANLLLDTVETLELIGPMVTPEMLLVRLFHEEAPRVFPLQSVCFGCSCSEERVRQSLSIYSARDIGTMTTDEGMVTADCQFCGAHYELEPASLGLQSPHAAARS